VRSPRARVPGGSLVAEHKKARPRFETETGVATRRLCRNLARHHGGYRDDAAIAEYIRYRGSHTVSEAGDSMGSPDRSRPAPLAAQRPSCVARQVSVTDASAFAELGPSADAGAASSTASITTVGAVSSPRAGVRVAVALHRRLAPEVPAGSVWLDGQRSPRR
jgi:hypothetical protein